MENQANVLLEGSIRRGILKFAFPIFLGSLFQQLYNMADALIVGNFAGDTALAAVTSVGSIVFLFVGFFTGMYQGMGVVIARYFGAKDQVNIRKSVCTAVVFGAISGVFLSLVGVLASNIIVKMVDTPAEVYQESVTYLKIYFCGSLFTAFYNTTCGICRALGDSKRPVHYLIIASIVNVILDIIFVGGLQWGVSGAAFATVIAQATSAGFCIYRVTHLGNNSIIIKKIKEDYDGNLLKQMINVGFPTGVQNSVISFANVVVQANINAFGTAVMAGNGAYSKLQGMVFLPIEALGMANTNFISQNLGANQVERVKKGAKFAVTFACVSVEIIGVFAFIFAPQLIAMFGGGAESIAVGVMKIRIDAFFYCFLAYAHSVAAVMRGAGRAKVPMFIMLGIWCVMRVIYIETAMHFTDQVQYVFYAYPLTWVTSCILFYLSYRTLKISWDEKVKNQALA